MPQDSTERTTAFERQLDHLYRFTGLVGSTLRVDMILEDTLSPLLHIGRARKVLISLAPLGEFDKPIIKKRNWDELGDLPVAPDDVALLGTDVLCAENNEDLPEFLEDLRGEQNLPLAVVPLWAYGRALGVLVFATNGDPFDALTVNLLLTAGRQLALAVENARLFAELEMSYHHMLYTQEETIRNERMAAVGTLAATMAHEIRNPLATIFSSLSQIKKHAQITGDSATLLQIAEEEAIRMNRIVSGLLEFARPGMPRFEEVTLSVIVRDVIQNISDNLDKDNKTKFIVTPEREDISAEVDATLFKKALHLILDNAVAAVDPDEGLITVEITQEMEQYQKKEIAVITITDNGHGVTREIQNKVFEPFYSTKPSGIGLGLPTVARIVNDHGGMVTFDSQYKKGTTVRMAFYLEQSDITLPLPPEEMGL
jgi:signal transduction histidine kinase